MSEFDDPKKPPPQKVVKDRVRRDLESGLVIFPPHARDRMVQRDIDAVDVNNTLRGGYITEQVHTGETWKHTMETGRIAVVFVLNEAGTVVVTTVRRRKK